MNPLGIRICKCGHDINHPLVAAKTKYSPLGYFWLSLAFSAKPIEVVFQCQECGEIVERTTDDEVIERYRYNSDILRGD